MFSYISLLLRYIFITNIFKHACSVSVLSLKSCCGNTLCKIEDHATSSIEQLSLAEAAASLFILTVLSS